MVSRRLGAARHDALRGLPGRSAPGDRLPAGRRDVEVAFPAAVRLGLAGAGRGAPGLDGGTAVPQPAWTAPAPILGPFSRHRDLGAGAGGIPGRGPGEEPSRSCLCPGLAGGELHAAAPAPAPATG